MLNPLADRIRPAGLVEIVGQNHLLGKGKILYKIINSGLIPNMIFYGPSGTGKTTVANIAAKTSNKKLVKLNATNASVSDIKAIINETGSLSAPDGILLYLDEIQNFNKKQQQSLLEVIENGQVTLIASTTENPNFYIYNALLSRCSLFEFKPVEPDDITKALKRATQILAEELNKKIDVSDQAVTHFSHIANGDVRKALNALELSCITNMAKGKKTVKIDLDAAVQATQRKALKYDRDGDSHYDILSAFQKSIRGSDPDAAVHYLARLIAAGDLISICRRLMVIASEDIGLAYPLGAVVTQSCVASALQLGLPEARIPLAEATLLLATSPKSNASVCAIDAALSDISNTDTGDIPLHLKDSHYAGAKKTGRGAAYIYPHGYKDHYVKQQYLPDNIKDANYYKFGSSKIEQAAKEYWRLVKGE